MLAYTVSNVSNPACSPSRPAVATNGTLTYTLAPDVVRHARTFDVQVQDNGGTANGGIDTIAATDLHHHRQPDRRHDDHDRHVSPASSVYGKR